MTWCLYISPPCSIHLQEVSSLPRSVCNKSSALVTFYGAGWICVSNRPNVFTALLGTICYLYQIPVSSYNVWHTILSMNKCVFWHLDCVPTTFVEGIHVCSFYVWIVTNAVFVHFFWGLDHSSNFIWRRRSMIQKRSTDQQRRVGSVTPPPPKTSMVKGDPPFEDVFPSWRREFSIGMLPFCGELSEVAMTWNLPERWSISDEKPGISENSVSQGPANFLDGVMFLSSWCFLDHMTMTTSSTLWLWYILVFYLYIRS